MKSLLLIYYDDRYREIGALAEASAGAFAARAGLEFCCMRQPIYPEPYLVKLDLLLSALEKYDSVVYADADVLFRPSATELWPGATTAPMLLSEDSNGLCAGVLSVSRHDGIIKLLQVWRALGGCKKLEPVFDCPFQQDQATLKLLIANFTWVEALVGTIPRDYVSNEECPVPGKVAHHFWCNVRGAAATAAKMRAFQWPS